jgi:hypothetical protein
MPGVEVAGPKRGLKKRKAPFSQGLPGLRGLAPGYRWDEHGETIAHSALVPELQLAKALDRCRGKAHTGVRLGIPGSQRVLKSTGSKQQCPFAVIGAVRE